MLNESAIKGTGSMTGKTKSPPKQKRLHESKFILVLASGGIDSTACLRFYLDQKDTVQALFVDYGQLSAKREFRAVSSVCDHYSVSLQTVICKGTKHKFDGLIFGRNAFLLNLALMEFPFTHGVIAIGVHAGTTYYDCSPVFLEATQNTFNAYTNGAIRIGTPFLNWTKAEIVTYCKQRGVPLAMTYSCELRRNQPCGQCVSCRDLEALNALT
jgi:7-cyano-7-deazaguanine synthase